MFNKKEKVDVENLYDVVKSIREVIGYGIKSERVGTLFNLPYETEVAHSDRIDNIEEDIKLIINFLGIEKKPESRIQAKFIKEVKK